MSNEWEETEKEDTQEDLSKRTDKGKSSHAFTAVNQVTLHEIADRNDTAIKGPNETTSQIDLHATIRALCVPDKSAKKKAMSGSSTTEV
jgi:hypothetical protein